MSSQENTRQRLITIRIRYTNGATDEFDLPVTLKLDSESLQEGFEQINELFYKTGSEGKVKISTPTGALCFFTENIMSVSIFEKRATE